jgi:penicillin-binding protein 1C
MHTPAGVPVTQARPDATPAPTGWRTRLRRAVASVTVLTTVGAAAFGAWLLTPPDPTLLARPAALGLTLTDRDGLPLRDTRGPEGTRWRWRPIGELDPLVISAFIAAEDRTFLAHRGVAWGALARAMRDNLVAGRVVSGASTISMQAARLLHDLPRGWTGKLRQIAWALRLERHLDKPAILEQYLNRVPLGQGTIGVEAASALYFGTSAARLGAGRAALLAGIARSPARLNPIASAERAARRRDGVLRALERGGQLTGAERERAESEPVGATGSRSGPFRAPHFTTRVLTSLDSVRDASPGHRQRAPATDAPLRVRTTLDLALQERIEDELRHVVRGLAAQRVQHAAAVVLDNDSGDVLAWVGSPDFAAARGQVDMVVSTRQPGSALKPFLYALAFERGYGAYSVLDDVPRTWPTSTGPYRPRNYDRRFRGPVRARVALGSSLNVPAVQLADALGTAAFLGLLHRAGFASLTRPADHYGLGLALGNGEVALLELANAYRALANGGVHTPVRRVLDGLPAFAGTSEGNAPSNARAPGASGPATRVVRADAAALTLDILTDADARLAGFGDAPVFDFPFPVAVKTGTSRHFTDNWAVGVTRGFTVAVWVGNFDGTPMAAVSGIMGAGPLLRRAVLATAERHEPGVLPSPASHGAERLRICRVSGLVAVPSCDAVDEWQLADAPPIAPDDWHRHGAVVLPARFAEWERSQQPSSAWMRQARVATATDSVRAFMLLSPRDGDVYLLPSGEARQVATVALRAIGHEAEGTLRWTVNGEQVSGPRWQPVPGDHVVRVESAAGAVREARVSVREADPRTGDAATRLPGPARAYAP